MARRFELIRDVDVSLVSGTGRVAEGVEFSDRSIALRWRSSTPSTTVFDRIEHVEAVHGHHGKTIVRWLDPPPVPQPPPRPPSPGVLHAAARLLPAPGGADQPRPPGP